MKVMYLCDFASFYDFGIRFWIRSDSVVFLGFLFKKNCDTKHIWRYQQAVHWFDIKRVSGSLESFFNWGLAMSDWFSVRQYGHLLNT